MGKLSLRKWLNNDFYNYAFNDEEKTKITEVNLHNANNSYYGTLGGNDTIDKLFLLSADEIDTFLPNNKTRKLGSMWWLRSPGNNNLYCISITKRGEITGYGSLVTYNLGVRPVLKLKY